MKVNQVEFVISAVSPQQYPKDTLPEIALAGRSNVGKSSFINCLVNRKNLARTSSTPGKTATLNFYKVENRFYFVDLPGYGYARVSKAEKAKWGKMIEEYLTKREHLRAVILLVDLRHPPTGDDQLMLDWLTAYGKDTIIVATKADKITRGRWKNHLQVVRDTLNLPEEQPVYLFSAETRQGRDEVWSAIRSRLGI